MWEPSLAGMQTMRTRIPGVREFRVQPYLCKIEGLCDSIFQLSILDAAAGITKILKLTCGLTHEKLSTTPSSVRVRLPSNRA